MLTMIQKQIKSVSDIPFGEYFKQYIMSVQDKNIDSEFRFLMKFNALNIDSMQNLIQNTYEGLKSIYDNGNGFTDSI